jgi:glycosyltransferase involved in cell wall biosynthesis
MKILVLYTRLTGYWLSCMQHDHFKNKNHYLVVRKTPSIEAPFVIKSEDGIEIIDGDGLSVIQLQNLARDFNPDLVYVSGWADKRFLKLAFYYKNKNVAVITGMDNQWLGTIRQYLATFISKWMVLRYFTHIWVPGKPQYFFARKLGFLPQQILTGLYCADERIFENIQQTQFNRQLLFVGRLVAHKGLKVFFNVLHELIAAQELHINIQFIGSGPLESEIPQHENIKHIPFVNPEDLPVFFENAGYFILPSLYEAWGVVVHEAVLAGLPILTTNECGAATDFVVNGFNGFVYDATDEKKLKSIIQQIMTIPEDQYFEMSANSKLIASKINLNEWAATLNSVTK